MSSDMVVCMWVAIVIILYVFHSQQSMLGAIAKTTVGCVLPQMVSTNIIVQQPDNWWVEKRIG